MSEKIRLTERWRVIERKEGDDATRTHSHGKRERARERVREPLFKVSLQKNWQKSTSGCLLVQSPKPYCPLSFKMKFKEASVSNFLSWCCSGEYLKKTISPYSVPSNKVKREMLLTLRHLWAEYNGPVGSSHPSVTTATILYLLLPFSTCNTKPSTF